jgi:ABC-2 type transport system permease protein
MARELRYWLRDNRRRIALLTAAASAVTFPLIWGIEGGSSARLSVTFSSSFSAVIAGSVVFQLFSLDGTAYATHLLTGVAARVDVRARVAALTLVLVPVLLAVAITFAVMTGQVARLPVALGALFATFGVTTGAASALSIDGAFPMPESRNPFATRTGGGTSKGLLSLVVMVGTVVCTAPVYVATYFVPAWAMPPIGLAWGLGAVALGTSVAAGRLSKRGPELLLAVTPRR